MAQLWVTYEELSRHLGCSPVLARDHVVHAGWPRRKCSDGATRVKLPHPVMDDYIHETWVRPSAAPSIALDWQPAWLGKQQAF